MPTASALEIEFALWLRTEPSIPHPKPNTALRHHAAGGLIMPGYKHQ